MEGEAARCMRYAENNASFIKKALSQISSQMETEAWECDYDDQTIPDSPGIYVFLACFEGKKYPVYLGKTQIGFKTRFVHHEAEQGVIWMYKNGRFPTFPTYQNPTLKVWLLEMKTPCIIKLAESIFLSSFDFALNKMENGDRRLNIWGIRKNTTRQSYAIFKDVQERMHRECKLIRIRLPS